MPLVICDCTVGHNGERYPKGVPCDLPADVIASLGGRAKPALEEALAPLVDERGEPVALPAGDPAVFEPIAGPHEPLVPLEGEAPAELAEAVQVSGETADGEVLAPIVRALPKKAPKTSR